MILAHGKRHAISRRHTDQRRPSDVHLLDGLGRIGGGPKRHDLETVWQPNLIDDAHLFVIITQPDGPLAHAVDVHVSLRLPESF